MRIPIVNEQDEIIGYKERGERNSNDLARATGLWVTDKDGNVLLSKRAFIKKHNPGLWGPAVAGTVEEGETYESNIKKEAEEEIGLKNIYLNMGSKIRTLSGFSQWFFVMVNHDYNFIKQDEEVEEIKWFNPYELEELINKKPEIFIPGFSDYIKFVK